MISSVTGSHKAWSTEDEKEALNLMASEKPRNGADRGPTIEQRRFRLKTWLKWVRRRVWGELIEVAFLEKHAKDLLRSL